MAAKKREADSLHPKVDEQGQKLPGLEEEYNRLHKCGMLLHDSAC